MLSSLQGCDGVALHVGHVHPRRDDWSHVQLLVLFVLSVSCALVSSNAFVAAMVIKVDVCQPDGCLQAEFSPSLLRRHMYTSRSVSLMVERESHPFHVLVNIL